MNFGTQKTMRIAQQLYEGIDIKGNGTVGVITYLRTDSTRISEEADAAAREYISSTYGKEYAAGAGCGQGIRKKRSRTPTRPSVLRISRGLRQRSRTLLQETSPACTSTFRSYFSASRMQPRAMRLRP